MANTERLIVKLLYQSPKSFSEKFATLLETASVSQHLKSLMRIGLVLHNDEGNYHLTKRGWVIL